MSLAEWFNSEPVRQFRSDILGSNPLDICSRCYKETIHSGTSRRHRSNQKSVIFTKQAFTESFQQSPGYDHFKFSQENNGLTNTFPIDLHIDLGNHCNLACKMCWPGASTRIASQYVKWGIKDSEQYLGVDWTKDSAVWNRFLDELVKIPKLKNIHFMGGETLLSPRFEQLVDFMIAHQRFDVNFSFVTNGTVYKPELIEKLKQFPRVGIEVSVETATKHNNYIRQGSDVNEVLNNIKKYKKLSYGSDVSVTVRSAISLLSIGNYYTLLEFCLEEQLLIKSLVVTTPVYLDPKNIPSAIQKNYALPYLRLLDKLPTINTSIDYNESDQNNYLYSIKTQITQVLSLLQEQTEAPAAKWIQLVEWCNRWDQVYNFDMLELYPEFKEIYDSVQR
jgi:sulfatase maturation enzyme AslB (radical SAM superfamily)